GDERGRGDEPRPPCLVRGRRDEDADADGLHPSADVRRERARPQQREGSVPQRGERPGECHEVTVTEAGTVQVMARDPRPGGRIVEVANFPTRFQADAALALLETNGIEAMAKYGDAEGWAPFFAMVDGFRVMVFDEDLDSARALLDSSDLFPPPPAS